jgi:hypothetical protein
VIVYEEQLFIFFISFVLHFVLVEDNGIVM